VISLTVIVPIYNEEQFLEQSVGRLIDSDIYENILLIDNNSFDNSYEIAKNLQKKYKKISIYKTDNIAGKGVVISFAKKLIETSHVIIHDADLEYFPSDIVEMFELAKKNPKSLILGSRFIGFKQRKNIYKRTLFANKIMSLFFSIIYVYSVSDVATCYKLMPSEFFKNTNFKEKGFSIEIELLSKFLKFNKSIIETPIKYEGRSYDEGKKIKAIDGFLYILNTLRYRFFA
jgi:dolichol-phosphate mannosyltransferase